MSEERLWRDLSQCAMSEERLWCDLSQCAMSEERLWRDLSSVGGTDKSRDGVNVFGMQLDMWSPPRSDVVAKYNLSLKFPQGEISNLETVSVCYWVQPTTLASYETHLSLAVSDQENDVLHLYRRGEHLGFYYNGVRQFGFPNLTSSIGLHVWSHYCHVFQRGEYRAYVGGEERARGPIFTTKASLSMQGIITLGQEQDQLAGGYDSSQTFRGYIAQLNIYNRSITDEEVDQQATCQGATLGDIFSSDREEMEKFGVSMETINVTEFCKKMVEYIIFPEMRYLPQSKLTCERVGYEVYSPTTPAENTMLHNSSVQFTEECKSNYHLWVGVTDEEEEDVWRKFVDNDVVTETVFETNEPNGGTGENCILMFLPNGRWVDTSCDIEWPACVPCQIDQTAPLRLRGLCYMNEAETFFEVLGYKGGKPFLHGYYGYMVYRNEREEWQMYDTTQSETVALVTLPSRDSYPIGRHVWTLKKSICNNLINSTIHMSFSVCNNFEFSCSNGDCILKEQRCNGKNDCTDFSDEDNCEMLVLPQGYRANQPPVNSSEDEPIYLTSIVRILRLVDISDVRRSINVEMELELWWQDLRLTYLNLGDTLELNKLTSEDTTSIWKPKITFPNVYDGNINTIEEEISLRKLADPQTPDFNDVKMDVAYTGESTLLVQKLHYSGTFACSFDVFYYPFDTQRCFILLQLASVRKEHTSFTSDKTTVDYLEEKLLPGYEVTHCTVAVTDRGNNETRHSMLQVRLELTRRWTVIVLAVYLPTSMLLCIGCSTLFIKLELLDVRLAVSLTTLLVLYTLFSNTSNSLPITAYVKMIDVWFFYCIFLLFFITLTHVLTEHMDNRERERPIVVHPLRRQKVEPKVREAERVLVTVRWVVVPVLVLLFNLIYWALLLGSAF
ncbi:uncharacterized protein LOC121867111 [Homarus americanus]|uniref:uncharacterized protein LOC121867111 n=1 Tax=Homarus americanus TaxID=6706 RepID=UPI001C48CA04|nr:uncharacterized protein LOC121867111 [Homarus americanus]